VKFKVSTNPFRLELVLDRYVILYLLGAGTAIMTAVSNVHL